MKIIFLDIDGVMNSGLYIDPLDKGSMLVEEHMSILNRIVLHPNVGVVITSAHRLGRSLKDLSEEFREAGFIGNIVGKTPSLGAGRPIEIAVFLESHPSVDSYVILDDMNNMGNLSNKLVCTYPTGLKSEHIEPVLAQLGLC
jgi:hypothetical protein